MFVCLFVCLFAVVVVVVVVVVFVVDVIVVAAVVVVFLAEDPSFGSYWLLLLAWNDVTAASSLDRISKRLEITIV